MKKDKSYLLNNLWNREDSKYYQQIEQDNLHKMFRQPVYKLLLKYKNIFEGRSIIDIGCGDGSKTFSISKRFNFSKVVGVDISNYAIKKAGSSYPKIKFNVCDIENLPYKDNSFDIVLTNYVLEHTSDSKKVLDEMYRVCKDGGLNIIICPNYGSPNRCSPPYKGNRIIKLFWGIINDFNLFNTKLKWNVVEPLSPDKGVHISDYDCTVEPYLLDTIRYYKSLNCKIVEYSSIWKDDKGGRFFHKLIKYLGNKGIFPFKYWGPQHFLVIKKLKMSKAIFKK